MVRVFRLAGGRRKLEMILQSVAQARYSFGEVKRKCNAERNKNDGKKMAEGA